MRGSFVGGTINYCASLSDEIKIVSAEFSSGIQNQSDLEQIRRTAGSTYSNLTTGSLASFQAMCGLSKAEKVETPNTLQITLVLIVLSVSAGLFVLYRNGLVQLSDITGRLSIPTNPSQLSGVSGNSRKTVDLIDAITGS